MRLPCWLVLSGRKPRWLFKKMKIIAGPKTCIVKRKEMTPQ